MTTEQRTRSSRERVEKTQRFVDPMKIIVEGTLIERLSQSDPRDAALTTETRQMPSTKENSVLVGVVHDPYDLRGTYAILIENQRAYSLWEQAYNSHRGLFNKRTGFLFSFPKEKVPKLEIKDPKAAVVRLNQIEEKRLFE